MIALIVNADDLGSNPDRDRGIFQAFREGIVTSVSLIANGPTFLSAAEHICQHHVPTGVHLNLADGRALSGEIKGLTDPCGSLPGKKRLREYLKAGSCDRHALRRELAAQIERVLEHNITPDHVDSHQHCQLFPCLSQIITELTAEYGIRAMRCIRPIEPAENDPQGTLGEELALYRQLAAEALNKVKIAGLLTPDGLWGMPLLHRLNEQNLCALLGSIPDGTWELMTHPGYAGKTSNPFDGKQRESELQALTSKAAAALVRQRDITLCSFGDLPCAS